MNYKERRIEICFFYIKREFISLLFIIILIVNLKGIVIILIMWLFDNLVLVF